MSQPCVILPLPSSLCPARAHRTGGLAYARFPLSLRGSEVMLAARGVDGACEAIRRRADKFGREFARHLRLPAPRRGDKWHMGEVAVAGRTRAVDQGGFVLDILVQSRGIGKPRGV